MLGSRPEPCYHSTHLLRAENYLFIICSFDPLKVTSHLTCECVSVLHLCGVRSSIGHKVDIDILANGLVHWPQFSLYEAAIFEMIRSVSRDVTCYLLNAVRTETLIEEVNVNLLRPRGCKDTGKGQQKTS